MWKSKYKNKHENDHLHVQMCIYNDQIMLIMKLQDKRNRSKHPNSFMQSKLVLQKGVWNSHVATKPNSSDDERVNHLSSIYTISNELALPN